jgi:hypothetical protein
MTVGGIIGIAYGIFALFAAYHCARYHYHDRKKPGDIGHALGNGAIAFALAPLWFWCWFNDDEFADYRRDRRRRSEKPAKRRIGQALFGKLTPEQREKADRRDGRPTV